MVREGVLHNMSICPKKYQDNLPLQYRVYITSAAVGKDCIILHSEGSAYAESSENMNGGTKPFYPL